MRVVRGVCMAVALMMVRALVAVLSLRGSCALGPVRPRPRALGVPLRPWRLIQHNRHDLVAALDMLLLDEAPPTAQRMHVRRLRRCAGTGTNAAAATAAGSPRPRMNTERPTRRAAMCDPCHMPFKHSNIAVHEQHCSPSRREGEDRACKQQGADLGAPAESHGRPLRACAHAHDAQWFAG